MVLLIIVEKGKAVYMVQKSAVICPWARIASGLVRTIAVKALMLSIPQNALIPSLSCRSLSFSVLNLLQQPHQLLMSAVQRLTGRAS